MVLRIVTANILIYVIVGVAVIRQGKVPTTEDDYSVSFTGIEEFVQVWDNKHLT